MYMGRVIITTSQVPLISVYKYTIEHAVTTKGHVGQERIVTLPKTQDSAVK